MGGYELNTHFPYHFLKCRFRYNKAFRLHITVLEAAVFNMASILLKHAKTVNYRLAIVNF